MSEIRPVDPKSAALGRTPARRGESVEIAAHWIRDGILGGRFVPGQRLIERDLTEVLGFSRGTVREAFGHLTSEGLLELVPNRGATVRRLSRREIRETFQIRELLEGLSARLAATAVELPGHRGRVQAVRRQVRVDVASHTEFHRQNLEIHGLLLEIGGNEQLAQTMAKMHVPFVMAQVRRSMGPEQIARSQREHLEILQAVAQGDPDAAEVAMRRHLRNTGEWMDSLDDPTGWPDAGV